MVGHENTGIVRVDASHLEENHCEICYFQDFGTCERILGKTKVEFVSNAPLVKDDHSVPGSRVNGVTNGVNGVTNGVNGVTNGVNGVTNGVNGVTNAEATTNAPRTKRGASAGRKF